MNKKRFCLFFSFTAICFLVLIQSNFGQSKAPAQGVTFRSRVGIAAAIPKYKNDPVYTSNTKSKPSISTSFKEEMEWTNNTSLIIGLEYMNHGFSFNSYYFAPGHSVLYDKTFSYMHLVRIHEAQIPLLFKISLTNEKKFSNTVYLFAGWGYRHLLYSKATISSEKNDTDIWEGRTNVSMEYPFLFTVKKGGSLLQGGVGTQKNFLASGHAFFMELTFKASIHRFHYTGNGSSNNLFIRDSNISFGAGYKF